MKIALLWIAIVVLLIIGCIIEYWHDKKQGQSLMDGLGYTWLMASFIAIMVALLVLASTYHVFAHDHEHPELNAWYQSLSSGKGLCCDGSDAVHLADPDWTTQDKPSHYRVYLDKEWYDVPDEAVINAPNRDGRALVWPSKGYLGTSIRCFMPGALT